MSSSSSVSPEKEAFLRVAETMRETNYESDRFTDTKILATIMSFRRDCEQFSSVHDLVRTFELLFYISRERTSEALELIRTGNIVNECWIGNNAGGYKMTPLWYAVTKNNPDIIRGILSHENFVLTVFSGTGADYFIIDTVGRSNYYKLKQETIKALLETERNGERVIVPSLRILESLEASDNMEIANWVAEFVNYPNKEKFSPLMRQVMVSTYRGTKGGRNIKDILDHATPIRMNACLPVVHGCLHDKPDCCCNYSLLTALIAFRKPVSFRRSTDEDTGKEVEDIARMIVGHPKFKLDNEAKVGPNQGTVMHLAYDKGYSFDFLLQLGELWKQEGLPEPRDKSGTSFLFYMFALRLFPKHHSLSHESASEFIEQMIEYGFDVNYTVPRNSGLDDHEQRCICGQSLLSFSMGTETLSPFYLGIAQTLINNYSKVVVDYSTLIGQSRLPLVHYVIQCAKDPGTYTVHVIHQRTFSWFIGRVGRENYDALNEKVNGLTPLEFALSLSNREDGTMNLRRTRQERSNDPQPRIDNKRPNPGPDGPWHRTPIPELLDGSVPRRPQPPVPIKRFTADDFSRYNRVINPTFFIVQTLLDNGALIYQKTTIPLAEERVAGGHMLDQVLNLLKSKTYDNQRM
jgi:hypothetical protein